MAQPRASLLGPTGSGPRLWGPSAPVCGDFRMGVLERGRSQRDDKFRFLWRWHLFLIHFNYDNTKISCRWHLFLIHFWTKKRKYLVQLLISCHTIRQSAAPCREHVERVRLVRHRVFRLLMTVSVRNGEKDALR